MVFTRREFLQAGVAATLITAGNALGQTTAASETAMIRPLPLNVLLITVDDMNFDTPNIVKGTAPAVTPNIDALAREGFRFVHSHVTVAVCQPSRETLMTGRFPHRSGAMGFYPVKKDVPTLTESLHAAGYTLGILGKVGHLAPAEKFPWDYKRGADELGMGRDPGLYYKSAVEFLRQAKADGKPFFLMANSHDPHRPFAGSAGDDAANAAKPREAAAGEEKGDAVHPMPHPAPGRTYKPEEVVVPGFLPDLPEVRKELAQYCSSAHRADETVGEVLRALKESGMEERTLVIFLSDNGMSFPFAKSNCYLTSTRTPLIFRWPRAIKPGKVDDQHMVAGIDFMPTVLEILKLPAPAGMDGRSYVPVLLGEKQAGRDHVVTVYHETAANIDFSMRCRQDKQFGYIYNAWSDGKKQYRADNTSGLSFAAMKEAGKEDRTLAERADFYLHRVPEEFYDLQADPNCLKNLAKEPAYAEKLAAYRAMLLKQMEATQDPLADSLRKVAAGK